jgi:hypothetical protein
MIQNKLKTAIRYTLQMLISICIALEISLPPNPYKTHLIILLTLYICLKHNVVDKIMTVYNKVLTFLRNRTFG